MKEAEAKIAALKFSIEMCQATRLATIEECARSAEDYFDGTPSEIAKAIRSLKSVPMDKEG